LDVPEQFLDVRYLFRNVREELLDVPTLFPYLPEQLLDVRYLFRNVREQLWAVPEELLDIPKLLLWVPVLVFVVEQQLNIQTQAFQFFDQHVERFRQASIKEVVALNDLLVHRSTALNIV
jgi:hypothetical protein